MPAPLARPLTLCYHAASATLRDELSLPQATIEEQIEGFIRRGFRPARIADVVQGRGRLLHVTFDDAFASTSEVVARLAARGIASTIFVCTGLAERGGAPLAIKRLEHELHDHPNELATLRWSDLACLSSDLDVEIGSHTVSHASLCELSDDQLMKELRESETMVEDNVGRPCRY